MKKEVLFSSNKDEWSTPEKFFEALDKEFHFDLDPCASHENHKCNKYYTEEDDGLRQDWGGQTCFVNPPYSQNKKWVRKCYEESLKPNTTVVLLVPARTDVGWFHEYVFGKADVRLVRGRLRFGGSGENAPFPSMVCVYGANKEMYRPEETMCVSRMQRELDDV